MNKPPPNTVINDAKNVIMANGKSLSARLA